MILSEERLRQIEANLPPADADLSRGERDAHDLLTEVYRLRERQEDHDLVNEAIRWKREALRWKNEVKRLRAIEAGVKDMADVWRSALNPPPDAGMEEFVASEWARCLRAHLPTLNRLLNPTGGSPTEEAERE